MPKDPYQWPWPKIRAAILQRDGYVCQIRGPKCLKVATTADHIVGVADGGAWYDPDNLRAACGPCNYGRDHRRDRPAGVGPSRRW